MAAVSIEGKVLTWGNGESGCLGHGSTQTIRIPCVIETLVSQRIMYLECGGYHNAAVHEEGEV